VLLPCWRSESCTTIFGWELLLLRLLAAILRARCAGLRGAVLIGALQGGGGVLCMLGGRLSACRVSSIAAAGH
jgi:hypothetical protein